MEKGKIFPKSHGCWDLVPRWSISSEKNQKGGRIYLGLESTGGFPLLLCPHSLFCDGSFLTRSYPGLPPSSFLGAALRAAVRFFSSTSLSLSKNREFLPGFLLLPARRAVAGSRSELRRSMYKVRGAVLWKHSVSHMNEDDPPQWE